MQNLFKVKFDRIDTAVQSVLTQFQIIDTIKKITPYALKRQIIYRCCFQKLEKL